ncbi:Major Facilitator Superfamily protein [Bradyrhizobium erythrophlei]|nr:Major Facilitator Superfamily protein [Bradyrhizobium erythrophlei]
MAFNAPNGAEIKSNTNQASGPFNECRAGNARAAQITLRIVPFVMLLYFIAFVDRVNIGFAALTMNKDLGFSPTVFGFGARNFLSRVFPVRGAVKPRSRQGRSPDLDRTGDDHLGLDFGSHGIRAGLHQFLHAALLAWRSRGRLLSRHHSLWAPQIIKEFGLSSLQVGFLNAPPGVVAIVAMVLWARHSDRSGERTWHVVSACMLASLGLVLAGFAGTVLAVLLALTLFNIGISSAKPPLWSMPTMFLSGSAAAAGIATINSIGNLGGFVGPAMIGWIKDLTGRFQGGLFFVAALLVLSAVLTLVLARSQRTSAATAANALPQQ